VSRVVQLTLTMSPTGDIVAEIPFNGGRRHLPVSDFESIRRILAAQLHRSESTIGTDGAPTSSQVRHWEQHLERSDPKTGHILSVSKLQPDTCIWCLAHTMGLATDERAHKRARAILKEQRRMQTRPFTMGDGSVTVRRIPAQDKRIRPKGRKQEPLVVMDFDDIDFTQA